jgi:hypothetical protein
VALAWTNVALHAAGLAMAWIGLRPGSVMIPLTERMTYLLNRPPAWAWGWGIWMLCALVLVAFMAALRRRLPGDPFFAQLALVFTVAGMAVDLVCDMIQIRALPEAAQAGPAVFLAFEGLAFTGGLTVANGLYTIGLLLMNLRLRNLVGASAQWAGWVSVVWGLTLAIAGFFPSPVLLQTATGLTIGSYCLWTVLVARDLR